MSLSLSVTWIICLENVSICINSSPALSVGNSKNNIRARVNNVIDLWGFLWSCYIRILSFFILRPRQNGRHFPDDIFKCIFLYENVWIPLKISFTFVPKGPINNVPTLVQILACRRPGDKPLSEPMVVNLSTHKCVTRPQWVKYKPLTCVIFRI